MVRELSPRSHAQHEHSKLHPRRSPRLLREVGGALGEPTAENNALLRRIGRGPGGAGNGLLRNEARRGEHAEAAVRALAAGLEPPPSFDALGSARSVPATALIGAADTRVSARIELSLEEAPQTPAGGFGGFGPLPIHRHSAIPAAAPRLEPPPGTTPAQCAPSTARISGAALPIAPNTTPTPSRLPGLDIGIADSFFDGVDATPAAASRSAATEGLGGSGVQGGGGRGSLTMAPVQRQEAKGDDDEEEDLLPLLDDPDAD